MKQGVAPGEWAASFGRWDLLDGILSLAPALESMSSCATGFTGLIAQGA